jgi:RHS repeat-associated protein
VTAGSGPQPSLSFNNNNQPIGYPYDASGNMTVEPVAPSANKMIYSAENEMIGFSGNGGAAQYVYDGNGLRVFKEAYYSGGVNRASVYSGSQVIAEYDNDNEDPSTPAVEYIYNPAGGGLLAMISNGAITYYHQDHLSVRLTTDANGNVLTQQGTYPFGEPWYSSSNLAPGDNWVFTNYDRDQESGLDYALARYYDSRTGTFCSADPLAGSPDDPQSWNRYPYGRNDPIDIADPSGQSWWSPFLDLGIMIGMDLLPELEPAWFGWMAGGESEADILATGGSNPGHVIGLPTRGAAETAAGGAGDAAAVGGGGFGSGVFALSAAAAAQAADQSKNPEKQHLNDAMGIAMQALNKKPCADMYGTPESRAKGFTPQNVLNGIVSGNKYGRIQWVNAGETDWTATTYPSGLPPIPGFAPSVRIKINTYNGPGYWGSGDAADNAETLLHELGHAFNFIHGAGGFPVSNFTEFRHPYAFDDEVKKNCFQ